MKTSHRVLYERNGSELPDCLNLNFCCTFYEFFHLFLNFLRVGTGNQVSWFLLFSNFCFTFLFLPEYYWLLEGGWMHFLKLGMRTSSTQLLFSLQSAGPPVIPMSTSRKIIFRPCPNVPMSTSRYKNLQTVFQQGNL